MHAPLSMKKYITGEKSTLQAATGSIALNMHSVQEVLDRFVTAQAKFLKPEK